MNLKITAATVLIGRNGCDVVYLETELPSAVHPFEGKQDLKFDVAKDKGTEYIRTHFPGVPITVIGAAST